MKPWPISRSARLSCSERIQARRTAIRTAIRPSFASRSSGRKCRRTVASTRQRSSGLLGGSRLPKSGSYELASSGGVGPTVARLRCFRGLDTVCHPLVRNARRVPTLRHSPKSGGSCASCNWPTLRLAGRGARRKPGRAFRPRSVAPRLRHRQGRSHQPSTGRRRCCLPRAPVRAEGSRFCFRERTGVCGAAMDRHVANEAPERNAVGARTPDGGSPHGGPPLPGAVCRGAAVAGTRHGCSGNAQVWERSCFLSQQSSSRTRCRRSSASPHLCSFGASGEE